MSPSPLDPQMFGVFFPEPFYPKWKNGPLKKSFCTLFSQATACHNQTNLQYTTESISLFFFFFLNLHSNDGLGTTVNKCGTSLVLSVGPAALQHSIMSYRLKLSKAKIRCCNQLGCFLQYHLKEISSGPRGTCKVNWVWLWPAVQEPVTPYFFFLIFPTGKFKYLFCFCLFFCKKKKKRYLQTYLKIFCVQIESDLAQARCVCRASYHCMCGEKSSVWSRLSLSLLHLHACLPVINT